MSSLLTSLVVLALVLGSTAIGLLFRLPPRHVDGDSRDVVKSVLGLMSTLTAVVLSFLIASAKSSFDTQRTEVQEIAAKVVLLDRLFVVYGPEATDVRALFRNNMIAAVERVWPTDRSKTVDLNPLSDRLSTQSYVERLRGLSPTSDVQRAILTQVLQLSTSIGETQLLMYAQAGSTVSVGLLVVLVFWISVLFLGFGLFARANAMVMGALFVGALSASGAVFLILDLDEPYTGLLRIPDTAMRNALALMGQ